MLLQHSSKHEWHCGEYKQQSNTVEARMPDGSRQIIFQTTEPGLATRDAMYSLVYWHRQEKQVHPLVKCALFCYEFVTIHPFQDGNGRLSRLLATLLLLKNGYKWIEYVSFEHEIESRMSEYYRVLRSSQANRPGEDVNDWVWFFFDALGNIQRQLMDKLSLQGVEASLSPRDKAIITFISNNPGCKSGQISEELGYPAPTVKRTLANLVDKNLLVKHGIGPGTNYTTT